MSRNSNNLEDKKILSIIKKYNLIEENDKIVIGVSGGPDSMCLLDVLFKNKDKLNVKVIVAHVNHQIRAEANNETEYVKEYCKTRNIPCFIKKIDVISLAKKQKIGTEEMGRKIRYEFFEEVANKESANKIATAHNANDNSETVLMNIIRGSGISGLKGIEIKRKNLLTNVEYIRPLLEIKREEIENYCKENRLNPKIDKSNFENIYTRNKIRNNLIPYLENEFNSNIIDTLNRLSNIAKEEEVYFSNIVKQLYKEILIEEKQDEIILDLKKLNNQEKVIKEKLIIYTINRLIKTTNGIGKVHIEDIIKLCENNIGNKYLTPNKNIKILVGKGKINLKKQ